MQVSQATLFVATLCFAAQLHALDFFDDLKKAVQSTAERTVINVASDMVRDMIVDATTVQTSTEKEVKKEYEEANGSLPEKMTVTAYRTLILPGEQIKAGTKVKVKSYIEVVPGRDGKHARIEEKLTIWDNEDNSIPLKSMVKEAGESGGVYEGEFSFTLPEGLPQGVYPVSTSLMMDGEWIRDEKHELQLVFLASDGTEVIAQFKPPR